MREKRKKLYLNLFIILLIFSYATLYLSDTIPIRDVWNVYPGSIISLELRDAGLDSENYTIVDEIFSEYKFSISGKVYIKLDSNIATVDPNKLAESIVNLSMPYDLSVSTDKNVYFRVEKYILPIFLPLNMEDIEKALSSIPNLEFYSKRPALTGLVMWYIAYNLSYYKIKIHMTIDGRNCKYLDGFRIEAEYNGTKEYFEIVSSTQSHIKCRISFDEQTIVRLFSLFIGVLGASFGGLYLRERSRITELEIIPLIELILERIKKHGKTYKTTWIIATITNSVIGFISLPLSTQYDSDIYYVIGIAYASITSLIMLIYFGWITSLLKLDRMIKEKKIEGIYALSPAAPLLLFVINFMVGAVSGDLKKLLRSPTLPILIIIMLVVVTIFLLIFNPKREISIKNR